MFRYESNHSAISPQELADELHLQWVRHYPAPLTAWNNQQEQYCYGGPGIDIQQKLAFDIAYQPVVMGSRNSCALLPPSAAVASVVVQAGVGPSLTELGTSRRLLWRFVRPPGAGRDILVGVGDVSPGSGRTRLR
jgi:hypothetical protein